MATYPSISESSVTMAKRPTTLNVDLKYKKSKNIAVSHNAKVNGVMPKNAQNKVEMKQSLSSKDKPNAKETTKITDATDNHSEIKCDRDVCGGNNVNDSNVNDSNFKEKTLNDAKNDFQQLRSKSNKLPKKPFGRVEVNRNESTRNEVGPTERFGSNAPYAGERYKKNLRKIPKRHQTNGKHKADQSKKASLSKNSVSQRRGRYHLRNIQTSISDTEENAETNDSVSALTDNSISKPNVLPQQYKVKESKDVVLKQARPKVGKLITTKVSAAQEISLTDDTCSDDEPLAKYKKIELISSVADDYDELRKCAHPLKERSNNAPSSSNAQESTIAVRKDAAKMAFGVRLNEFLAIYCETIKHIGIDHIAPQTFQHQYNDLRIRFRGVLSDFIKLKGKWTNNVEQSVTQLKQEIIKICYHFEEILKLLQLINLK